MMHKEAKRAGAQIGLGSPVTIADPNRVGKALKFTVVERREADPARGSVSMEAPIARAVIGREMGEEVVVPTPREERRYRIVSA
jgi:transcription elongation GreA/GreB family factor